MPLFTDAHMDTVCPRHSPGHHLEIHMLLIDRLETYLKVNMWETWWVASKTKHCFVWKPSNIKKLAKLVKKSCSVLPRPKNMEYHMVMHLNRNANELTTMVYCSTC